VTVAPEALIADHVSTFDPAQLDDQHRAIVARTLLDTHAVSVAGWHEPASIRYRQYAQTTGLIPPPTWDQIPESASLWVDRLRAAPEVVAVANGVAGHVLDYDDVNSEMRGHPSAVLWPALLALAEATDAPGERLVSAFVVGFELIVKLSRAMAQAHYAQGWHSTSGLGTVAGAIACAHLLSLDASATRSAIGIAIAQTAGTRQNFGSDAKSFQAGHACGAAVRSALMARAGFTGGALAMSGSGGFFDLYGGSVATFNDVLALSPMGSQELLSSGVEVKKYPMCYAAHRALDGMLDLRARTGIRLEDVATIRVTSSRGGLTPLIHHRPGTGLEGKFSMQYGVLAALADGRVDFQSFTDPAVLRPEIQSALSQVSTQEEGDALFPRWTRLDVALRNGQTLSKHVTTLRGSAGSPLSDEDLIAKANDCYRRAGVDLDGQSVHRAALQLHRSTTRQFMRSLLAAP
jgi:2-methylcitrate dehydratase PrpD